MDQDYCGVVNISTFAMLIDGQDAMHFDTRRPIEIYVGHMIGNEV